MGSFRDDAHSLIMMDSGNSQMGNHVQCACAHKNAHGVAILDGHSQIGNHVQCGCRHALHKEWPSWDNHHNSGAHKRMRMVWPDLLGKSF